MPAFSTIKDLLAEAEEQIAEIKRFEARPKSRYKAAPSKQYAKDLLRVVRKLTLKMEKEL